MLRFRPRLWTTGRRRGDALDGGSLASKDCDSVKQASMSDGMILGPPEDSDRSFIGSGGDVEGRKRASEPPLNAHRNQPVDFAASERRTDASDGVTALLRRPSQVASRHQKARGQNICWVQAQSELWWLVSR